MEHAEILIVGAGAAGISAAQTAAAAGCIDILLLDSGEKPGGILLQCTHRGFGKEMTGAEYAAQLLKDFPAAVRFFPATTVSMITDDKTAYLSDGSAVSFDQLIWAAGCREIPVGALPIAGTRPKGIYTAGQMQAMMNLHGYIPQGPAVILGSGDLGLIMARHLWDAGITVTLVEQKPVCGGLHRNRAAIANSPISILCSSTVTEVFGDTALEAVSLSDGTLLPCRTLLIAVGMLPEQEPVRHLTGRDWLHLCGNCNTIHPTVDTVVNEGKQAALTALKNIRGTL